MTGNYRAPAVICCPIYEFQVADILLLLYLQGQFYLEEEIMMKMNLETLKNMKLFIRHFSSLIYPPKMMSERETSPLSVASRPIMKVVNRYG